MIDLDYNKFRASEEWRLAMQHMASLGVSPDDDKEVARWFKFALAWHVVNKLNYKLDRDPATLDEALVEYKRAEATVAILEDAEAKLKALHEGAP